MRARQEEVGEEAQSRSDSGGPWRDPEQNWGSGAGHWRKGAYGWGALGGGSSEGQSRSLPWEGGVTRWPGVAARTGPS